MARMSRFFIVQIGTYPPGPVIRFAHCRLRLCLRRRGEWREVLRGIAREGVGFSWHYPFAQSHQNSPECNPLRKPCAPLFLAGKGAGGIGLWRRVVRRTQRSGNDEAVVGMCGVIRAIRAIRLIRDSDAAGWRGEAARAVEWSGLLLGVQHALKVRPKHLSGRLKFGY